VISLFFEYGEREIEYLKSRDKRLGEAIARIGPLERPVNGDLFSSVVRHIIGQQISSRAQATICQRLSDRLSCVNAETVSALSEDELQKLGITFKKAGYIKSFAEKVKNGEFDVGALAAMPDAEVIRALSALPGIGGWTAEMLMIYAMQRPDVISYGDLAIQRGLRMLYHHRSLDRKMFDKYARRYSPCATVASLYLWAIAGGAIPELRDLAPKKKKEAAKK
jgi:DNA-3-methyladenine glycosylase II